MKKLLLIALSVLSGFTAISAKELTFYVGDRTVANGETVEYAQYDTYPMGSKTEVFIDPMVYISKDVATSVSLKTTSNYPIQVCIGGQCEAAESIVKNNLSFDANKKENLLLDCSIMFAADEEIVLPAIDVLIEAWFTDDPANVTSFTLKMGDVAGITNVAAAKNRISVLNRVLNYNVEGTSNIVIFNLAGSPVYSQKVTGAGSLSLESLPVGIYLFRADGDAHATGKFIVR